MRSVNEQLFAGTPAAELVQRARAAITKDSFTTGAIPVR